MPGHIKPGDCIIGFGIPITPESYFKDINNPDYRKDYAKNMLPGGFQQFRTIFESAAYILSGYESLGVTIVQELKCSDLKQLLRTPQFKVLILFTHFSDTLGKVELFDGLYNNREIVEIIPSGFNKIIDLCACCSSSLGLTIKRKFPDYPIKIGHKVKNPVFWFSFYLAFFKIIEEENLNYGEAIEKTTYLFMKPTK